MLRSSRHRRWLALGGLLVMIGSGCGSGSGTSLPLVAITSMMPADGATGVVLNATVSATFNQQMNESTINSSTFSFIDASGAAVPGMISCNSSTFTATFIPDSPLMPNGTYTAAVSGGVANVANITLGTDVRWSFTSGTTP